MGRCTVLLPTLLAACATAPAPAPPPAADGVPPVRPEVIDAHLRYLADDLLEGRAPATRGGRLAAHYIASQFRALGLEPLGREGSYFQPVPLVGMVPHATLAWGPAGAPEQLAFGGDFVAWAERTEPRVNADADVVFVGYGISAPEWRWDDYKDEELRGKILLMLVNDPGIQDSSVFLGSVLTYYGRWTYKLEEAARRGAVGAILIHTAESATYPWAVVHGSWTVEQFKLDRPESPSLAFAGWVQYEAAAAALRRAGHDLAALTRAAATREFRPLRTGLHAAVTVESDVRRVPSENVAGMLRGSDPALAHEVVLFTAHWDHKGIGPAVDGDSIYNGAEDNASGVAAMLAAADALARGPRPRRSIVFLATTAEESGLLGSLAYASAPLIPLARTAAVLNIDETNLRGATRDVTALGLDRSTLGELFTGAAAAESLVVSTVPDVRGAFFRSDHFPLAKAGVPALSIETGLDVVGRPAGWGAAQEDRYRAQRYHQPSDEYAASFDYGGTVQQLRVLIRVALAVANAPALPRWLPSSEFQRPAAPR
jgi:Zn-dependent M28 family amino/carboxypeptidase